MHLTTPTSRPSDPTTKEEISETPYEGEYFLLMSIPLGRKAGCHTPGAGLHRNARDVFLVLYA